MPKPTDFPAAGPLTGAEVLPIIQAGVDSRSTLDAVGAYLGLGPSQLGGVSVRSANMDAWFAALENVNTTPVDVVAFGDSTAVTGDINDLDGEGRPWPWLLSDYLNRYIQSDPPVGYVPAATGGTGPAFDTNTGTYTGTDFSGLASTLAAGQAIEHTAICDRVTVVYRQTVGGGNIEVRDGGSGGTLLTTINTAGANTFSMMWTSAALTAASHTIWIGRTSGTPVVAGAYFYLGNYDKGVRVWPACKSGADSTTPVTAGGFAHELMAQVDADLVIYATGINDYANYDPRMQELIDDYAGEYTGSSVIWNPYILPVGDRWTKASADLARGYATSNGFGIIDASIALPDISVDDADMLVDTTHPNRAGNRRIAAHAAMILSGDPIGTLLAVADGPGWATSPGLVRTTRAVVASSVAGDDGGIALADIGFGPGIFWSATSILALPPSESGALASRAQVVAVRGNPMLPTGAIGSTLPRSIVVGNSAWLVSGTVSVVAVSLMAGDSISSISFVSRNTAGAGMTNQWFALLDTNRVVLAVSADDTSTAWGANAVKTLVMTAPYVVPTTGIYYLAAMVAGSVIPTLAAAVSAATVLSGIPPISVGVSSTGQTAPPAVGATLAAITVSGTTGSVPYAYWS